MTTETKEKVMAADHKAEHKETKETPLPFPTPKTMREQLENEQAGHQLFVKAHLPTDVDEPFKVAEPVKLTDDQKKAAQAKADLLKQIGVILEKYNNNESSIPTTSEYWGLVNQYRAMLNS